MPLQCSAVLVDGRSVVHAYTKQIEIDSDVRAKRTTRQIGSRKPLVRMIETKGMLTRGEVPVERLRCRTAGFSIGRCFVQRDGCLNKGLERGFVDFRPFREVDGAPDVAFQA